MGGGLSWRSQNPTAGSRHTLLSSWRAGIVVVSLPSGRFKATYYKPPGRPNLILRERTKTDDDELLADAFQAAVAKARELGWIVSADTALAGACGG